MRPIYRNRRRPPIEIYRSLLKLIEIYRSYARLSIEIYFSAHSLVALFHEILNWIAILIP